MSEAMLLQQTRTELEQVSQTITAKMHHNQVANRSLQHNLAKSTL
jgi:hypothetical protein